jgi:hypothetical protein
MASPKALAIRANNACDRIEETLTAQGVEVGTLPRLHNDREYLRVVQLEAIADALANLPTDDLARVRELISGRYTKDELEELVNGIDRQRNQRNQATSGR